MKLKPVALSLSQSEIDEIATELLEAMQLDWSRAITSITLSQFPYTAPEDGVLFMQPQVEATSSINRKTVYVNGVAINEVVPSLPVGGTDYRRPSDLYIQLKKGDVVSFSSTQYLELRAATVFVPFKTMNPVSLRPLDPHKIDTAILNHWDDITSDFSIAGSTSGVVLNYVKYNPVLRMLKYKFTRNQSTAANSTEKHELIYNGSDMIAFNADSTILLESINFVSAYITGYEVSSKIMSSNHIEINIYNGNVNSAWESGHYFTGVIYL